MASELSSDYKFVSASATAVDTVLKPLNLQLHSAMVKGTDSIKKKTDSMLTSLNSSTRGFLCFLTKPLQGLNSLSNYLARTSAIQSYKDLQHSLEIVSRGFDKRQQEYENYFKQHGKSTNNDWVFSIENRKLIKQILDYMASNLGEVKDYPFYITLRYIKAYGKLQKYERRTRPIKTIEMDKFLENGLRKLNVFSKFAAGVYGGSLPDSVKPEDRENEMKRTTTRQRFAMYTGISDEEIIVYDDQANYFLPGYAIVVSHQLKAVIVAIRGTAELFDVVADLDSDEDKRNIVDPSNGHVLAEGDVHKGMFKCAQNIDALVKPKVLELIKQYKKYEVVICGHSLGGGTTALLAMIWLSDKTIMKRGFTAYALAPPPVVTQSLNLQLKKVLFSASVGDDVVTRVSEGSIKDLGEAVKYFYHSEHSEKFATTKTKSISLESSEDKLFREEYQNIQSKFTNPKLLTPGNLVLLLKKGVHASYPLLSKQNQEEEVSWSFIDSSSCSELILSKTMVADHSSLGYVECISSATKSLS
jgi:hypothetical protein